MEDLSKFPVCKHVTLDCEVPERFMRRAYNSVKIFTGHCNCHWESHCARWARKTPTWYVTDSLFQYKPRIFWFRGLSHGATFIPPWVSTYTSQSQTDTSFQYKQTYMHKHTNNYTKQQYNRRPSVAWSWAFPPRLTISGRSDRPRT